MAPHTILFIAANPVGMDRRALDDQARAVQIELERAGRRDCFQFETRWAAQPLDLLREMVKHKPTVVHFCGGRVIGGSKGAPPAGVHFQAADGRAQLVPARALASAFDAAGSVKLVVLDACYSEEHAAAVAADIDCVVGMAGETVDRAATSFAIGLYGGLGEGESVAAAFQQGCAAIGMTWAGDPDQLRKFALAEEPPSTSVQQTVILGATELLEVGDDALMFQRYRRDADSFAHLVAASANTSASARFMTVCGKGLRQLGELVAARQLLEQALASALRTYGEDHPAVARGRNNLALVLLALGEPAVAADEI